MRFEWDRAKASANLTKHEVSFEEALTVFADPDALDAQDLTHSTAEQRFLRIGRSILGRILSVAYALRGASNAEAIRIISARRASRKERTAYFSAQAAD